MVKPGYKQTEVGIIPEAWDISSLAAAFPKLEAGVSVNSDNKLSSEYHVLKTSAVHDGVVDVAETKPIVPQDYHRVKCPLVKGSMVISRMNTPALVGECGFVKNVKDGTYLPDRLWQVKNPPGSSFDFEWLNYLLNTKQYRDAVRATATGTSNSMKNISKERLLEIKIPHPPIDEQRHITSILSNLDELIHLVEQQISKKKAIKQGAMQELLSGKKHLPGFSGEWNSFLLKEVITDFVVPMRDKPKDLNGSIPWCRIEDFDGKYLYGSKTNQGVTVDTVIRMNLKVFPTNTLLVSCSAYLGRCAIVKSELVTNQTFIGLIPSNKVDIEFLFYVMSAEEKNLNLLSSGTTISYLSREQFEDYKIYIPCDVSEQSCIASILSGMDCEIEILEQKLAKYRQLKQGMMQQLLTGKIRLVK